MLNINLTDTFSFKGHFHLPNQNEKNAPGIVSYSQAKGITVELLGTLDESLDTPKKQPIIIGKTKHGICTLLDATGIGTLRSSHGPIESTYRASFLLLGYGVLKSELFSSSHFELNHLPLFLNYNPFSKSHTKDSNNVLSTKIEHTPLKTISYQIPTLNLAIKLSESSTYALDKISASIHRHPQISIQPTYPTPLTTHLKNIQRLCSLLSLLTDETITPIRSHVRTPESDETLSLAYEYPLIVGATKSTPSPLFTFQAIETQFETILNNWLTASGILQDAFELFDAGRHARDSTIQARFLILTQSIEAFSRATTSSKYMEDDEYKAVRQQLCSHIPQNVSKPHRDSLKKRIEFGNEFSLRKRIAALLQGLSKESLELVCCNKENFIAGVVSTRNYLTHYTDDLRLEALTDADLFWACEKLTTLLRILLLKSLGIDEALIYQHIIAHHRLAQKVKIAKNYAESTNNQHP